VHALRRVCLQQSAAVLLDCPGLLSALTATALAGLVCTALKHSPSAAATMDIWRLPCALNATRAALTVLAPACRNRGCSSSGRSGSSRSNSRQARHMQI
jgi:hypothetical protein